MANDSDVTSVLNSLVETAKDGENGFRHATEHAKDSSLKSIFTRYASQRASYASELQALVASLGDKPAESGHVGGALHRGWIGLKSALTGENLPVLKSPQTLNSRRAIAERTNMVYMGTRVTGGQGLAIVVATGAGR